DAEDRGVDSDSERQRDDGHAGEAWILAEHTQAVADILQSCFEELTDAGFAAFLLHSLDAPELLPRGASGFLRRHAAPDKFLGTRFDMEQQLVVQVAIHMTAAENIGDARQPGHHLLLGPLQNMADSGRYGAPTGLLCSEA